jgi:hypothetical protein
LVSIAALIKPAPPENSTGPAFRYAVAVGLNGKGSPAAGGGASMSDLGPAYSSMLAV